MLDLGTESGQEDENWSELSTSLHRGPDVFHSAGTVKCA